MITLLRNLWQIIWGQPESKVETSPVQPESLTATGPFELEPGDPLFDFLQGAAGTVELPASGKNQSWRKLAEFSLASILGNEREAIRQVGQAVQTLSIPDSLLDRLKTAVAEATMNAIEHGNKNQPDLPVVIQVQASPTAVRVRITDQGGGQPIPEPEAPNLEAKLAGLQTPRGWGLFLIKNLTDEMRVISNHTHHTIELTLYLEAEKNVSQGS